MLYVRPDLRGRGYGARALKHAEERLRKTGCRCVKVYVGSLDGRTPPASEFYRKQGYRHRSPNMQNWLAELFGWNGIPQGGYMDKDLGSA